MAAYQSSSGPVQVIPPGLLGFLQLKNSGVNPQQLQNGYTPTLDMLHWLLRGREEIMGTVANPCSVAIANGVVGNFQVFTTNSIQVPDDEWWYVHDYAVYTDALLAATSIVQFTCAVQSTTAGQIGKLYGTSQSLLAGSAAGRIGMAQAHDFFVASGSFLGFAPSVNEVAAGNITYQGTVRFTRLPN